MPDFSRAELQRPLEQLAEIRATVKPGIDAAVATDRGDGLSALEAAARKINELTEQRDRWIRLFNRLEGAVAHHRKARVGEKAKLLTFCDEIDDALYAAHDRVLKAAAKGDG